MADWQIWFLSLYACVALILLVLALGVFLNCSDGLDQGMRAGDLVMWIGGAIYWLPVLILVAIVGFLRLVVDIMKWGLGLPKTSTVV